MHRFVAIGLLIIPLTTALACGGEQPFTPGAPPGYDPERWFLAVDIELNLDWEVSRGGSKEVQVLIPGPVTPPGPPNEPRPQIGEFFLVGEPEPMSDSPIHIQQFIPDGNGGWRAEAWAVAGAINDLNPAGLYEYRIVELTVSGRRVISNRARFCVIVCP